MDCHQDVSIWMKNSKLKLSADITELPIIGTPTQRRKYDGFFSTHIMSQGITSAASVLNFGVTFDDIFNLKQSISNTCRCYFYHIRDFRRVRRYISMHAAKSFATCQVSRRLYPAIP